MSFKNRLSRQIQKLNDQLDEFSLLTPQVCYLQVCRLQKMIKKERKAVTESNHILRLGTFSMRRLFLKDCVENIENIPIIDTTGSSQPMLPSCVQQLTSGIKTMIEDLDEIGDPMSDYWDKEPFGSSASETNVDFLFSTEEEDVRAFFARHPDIEQARLKQIEVVKNEIKSKRLIKVQKLVNKKGMVAKSLYLENGDMYLMHKDSKGRSVVSKAVRSKWKKLNQPGVDNSDTMIKLASSIKPTLASGIQNYVSRIHTSAFNQIGTVGFGAASGALGELLYELLEGSKKLKHVPRELVTRSIEDVLITVGVGFAPSIAILVATVLGAYSIYRFVTNKSITSQQKFLLTVELFFKVTIKSACAIGGALIGSALVPIPILGSLIGGVAGGFLGAASIGTLGQLSKNEVIFEGFAFYCLCMFRKHACWQPNLKFKSCISMKLFENFSCLLSSISYLTPKDLNDLIYSKADTYHRLVDAVYLKIVPSKEREHGSLERKQAIQTLIAFSMISYFYYVCSFKCKQLRKQGHLTQAQYTHAAEKLGERMTIELVGKYISDNFELVQDCSYDQLVLIIKQLVDSGVIKCLFKIPIN